MRKPGISNIYLTHIEKIKLSLEMYVCMSFASEWQIAFTFILVRAAYEVFLG